MEANGRWILLFASIYLLHKEQVKLYLSSELDGLHWSAMPAAEGDVVVVDVPVASLNLSQQSALGTLGCAEDGVWSDVVSQYR